MSSHRHVKEALDKAVHAHRHSHQDALEAAGLGEFTEATISPVGTADAPLTPAGDDNA